MTISLFGQNMLQPLYYAYSLVSGTSCIEQRTEQLLECAPYSANWWGHRVVIFIEYCPFIGLIALCFERYFPRSIPKQDTDCIQEILKPIIPDEVIPETTKIDPPLSELINSPTIEIKPLPPEVAILPTKTSPLDLTPEQLVTFTMAALILTVPKLPYVGSFLEPYVNMFHYIPKNLTLGYFGANIALNAYLAFQIKEATDLKNAEELKDLPELKAIADQKAEEVFKSGLKTGALNATGQFILHTTPLNALYQAYKTGNIVIGAATGSLTALRHLNRDNYLTVVRNLAVYAINTHFSTSFLLKACEASTARILPTEDFLSKNIRPLAPLLLSNSSIATVENYGKSLKDLAFSYFPIISALPSINLFPTCPAINWKDFCPIDNNPYC